MSWEATKWAASNLLASGPQQLVLILLGNVADPGGRLAYISIEYLARKSRQSRASVFRRLAEIEAYGTPDKDGKVVGERIFERVRAKDERGRVVYAGRLFLDRRVVVRLSCDDDLGPVEEDEERSQLETAESQPETPSAENESQVETQRVSDCDSHISSNITLEYPSHGSVNAREAEKERIDSEFKDFGLAFGVRPGEPVGAAREEFGRLNAKDRQKATRKAVLAREFWTGQNRKHRMPPEKWLRLREFDHIADVEQAAALAAGKPRPDQFAKRGTPAFDLNVALMSLTQARYRDGNAEPRCSAGLDGGTGIYVQDYFPNMSHAVFAAFDDPRYEAWRRFTAAKLGRDPKFFTMKSVDFKGHEKPGWYFPSEWPPGWQEALGQGAGAPRADAAARATGPPPPGDDDGLALGEQNYG